MVNSRKGNAVRNLLVSVALVGAVAAYQNDVFASIGHEPDLQVVYETVPSATHADARRAFRRVVRADRRGYLRGDEKCAWLLRMLMFGEARGLGSEGMERTGWVAWNRAGKSCKRLERVFYAPSQFSFLGDHNRELIRGYKSFTGLTALRWTQSGVIAELITHDAA